MADKYYSSVDCQILIGGLAADEVVGINFSETEDMLPIYGWKSREWGKLGKGKILVTGSIIYNGRVPQYLERLVHGQNVPMPGTEQGTAHDRNIKNIREKLAASEKIDVAQVDMQVLLEVARLNKKYSSRDMTQLTYENVAPISDVLTKIELNYYNADVTDLITDVAFVGQATEIQSGASNNIKYARSFIAKRVKQVVSSQAAVTPV